MPQDIRVYAVGDIHGHARALECMHDSIDAHRGRNSSGRQDVVVYLGDYVDRGPDSQGVIETLLVRQKQRPDIRHHFLTGNHEIAMLNFLRDPLSGPVWLQWGGIETLESYGICPGTIGSDTGLQELQQELAAALPQAHLDFLARLEIYAAYGDYLFVHAGIRPGVPLAQQTYEDLTFIREPFLDSDKGHDKRVVHGHTITSAPQVFHNRIGIDTGVFVYGTLTCAVLEAGRDVDFLQVTSPDVTSE